MKSASLICLAWLWREPTVLIRDEEAYGGGCESPSEIVPPTVLTLCICRSIGELDEGISIREPVRGQRPSAFNARSRDLYGDVK